MRRDRSVKARREVALSRPELRSGVSEFYYDVSDKLPDEERKCMAKAQDMFGVYALPFPVYRTDDAWFNANADRRLEIIIVKWRYS